MLKLLLAEVLKDLPEPVNVLPPLPVWLNVLPVAVRGVAPPNPLPAVPEGPTDLDVWTLRLKIEVAPFRASGDLRPAVRVAVAFIVIPAVLVVGSTRRKSWVFGSRK